VSVEEFVAIMSADDLAAACAAIRDQIVAGRPAGRSGPGDLARGW
jgi:hypothetical protein